MSKATRFSVDFTTFLTEEYPHFAKFTEKELK